MFSRRVPSDLASNRLSRELAQAREQGRPIVDLTLSNPTRAGFEYPPDLLQPLSDRRALAYDPHPFGAAAARAAVAADYARQGVAVDPERIALTASTSEAYSLLFKLLADPGDDVLVPRPSYPLFDHLARLDVVEPRPYDLEYHGAWSIDFGSIERALTPRTRAILVVSPNNPTGSFIREHELAQLADICADRRLAIVADEVFADYPLDAAAPGARVSARDDVLGFALGGLSKSAGLPQVKLGWIAVSGRESERTSALERLELICDTYLSVSTPVQVAAPGLIRGGAGVREQIGARIRANYHWLQSAASETPCTVLRSEGGWSAVLQVPTLGSEEDLVVSLLSNDGVLVHPGYFFDFPRESFLVVSLLPPVDKFRDGVVRLLRHFDCTTAARS